MLIELLPTFGLVAEEEREEEVEIILYDNVINVFLPNCFINIYRKKIVTLLVNYEW